MGLFLRTAKPHADTSRPVENDKTQGVCYATGGPALDTLNALRPLHSERPAVLTGRAIVVSVLDGDREGPAFGARARALAAWRAKGAPLEGLEVALRHIDYDWRRPTDLEPVLREARAVGAVVAGSSEGGLFEYGSDDEIVGNLAALGGGAPPDFVMVGSVTRADEPTQKLRLMSPVAVRPRGLVRFRELAAHASFGVESAIERPFSDQVVLTRVKNS